MPEGEHRFRQASPVKPITAEQGRHVSYVGDGRNWTHAVLFKFWLELASTFANYAKWAVQNSHHVNHNCWQLVGQRHVTGTCRNFLVNANWYSEMGYISAVFKVYMHSPHEAQWYLKLERLSGGYCALRKWHALTLEEAMLSSKLETLALGFHILCSWGHIWDLQISWDCWFMCINPYQLLLRGTMAKTLPAAFL